MTRERADVLSTLCVLAAVLVLLAAISAWGAYLAAAQPVLERLDDRSRGGDGPRSAPEPQSTPSGGLGSPTIAGALERALALAIAKVAANEASLSATRADVALIWQVTEGHGSTHAERLAWLTAHSSCVMTDRALRRSERRTNCRWSRGLRDDDLEPAGWIARWGPWAAYAPRWARVRLYALRLVRGERRLRPCAERPWTWGGAMDHERALRRGLRRVTCVGTRNAGYVRAR